MKTYRFSTLLRVCGVPISSDRHYAAAKLQNPAVNEMDAVDPQCVLTVHHGEAFADAWWGEPGIHIFDVAGRAVFPKPLPADCGRVIGILQHSKDGMF